MLDVLLELIDGLDDLRDLHEVLVDLLDLHGVLLDLLDFQDALEDLVDVHLDVLDAHMICSGAGNERAREHLLHVAHTHTLTKRNEPSWSRISIINRKITSKTEITSLTGKM